MEDFNLNDAVEEFISRGYPEGDLVSHLAIDDILKVPHEGRTKDEAFKRLSRFGAFSAELKNKNILLENVRGQGYRIVPQRHHAAYAIGKYMRKVDSAASDCESEMDATDLEALTRQEQANHHELKRRFEAYKDGVEFNRLDHFSACKKLLGYAH